MKGVTSPLNPEISIEKYRELKDKLKLLEKENKNQIILIPCRGNQGWYEMAETSALLYYYRICETLKIKVNFESDINSYYKPYEIGRVRIRDPELVKTRIQKANYLKSSRKKDSCYIFTLNFTLSPLELEELKQKELERRNKNLTITQVNFLDPHLHHELIEASTKLHQICITKLDKLSSQTNGARLVNLIDGMITKYYTLCNNKTSFDEKIWQEFLEKTDLILYEIQLLSETKLLSYETSLSVSKIILNLKNIIKRKLK